MATMISALIPSTILVITLRVFFFFFSFIVLCFHEGVIYLFCRETKVQETVHFAKLSLPLMHTLG